MFCDYKKIVFWNIGVKISYYRKLSGLTQERLAEQIGISTNTLGRLERGRYNNNISLSLLLDIARGLKIDFRKLLDFNIADEKISNTVVEFVDNKK